MQPVAGEHPDQVRRQGREEVRQSAGRRQSQHSVARSPRAGRAGRVRCRHRPLPRRAARRVRGERVEQPLETAEIAQDPGGVAQGRVAAAQGRVEGGDLPDDVGAQVPPQDRRIDRRIGRRSTSGAPEGRVGQVHAQGQRQQRRGGPPEAQGLADVTGVVAGRGEEAGDGRPTARRPAGHREPWRVLPRPHPSGPGIPVPDRLRLDVEAGADLVDGEAGVPQETEGLGAPLRRVSLGWPHRGLSAHVSTVLE
ncbi:hypothetical protein ACRBEV_07075 [Methylobacterium phyllosphaerae]